MHRTSFLYIRTFVSIYRTWENFGGGKFWRINGSKVFGEEKFGESVGSLLKTLVFINIGGEKFWQIANRLPNSPKFSPSKIFPCLVICNVINYIIYTHKKYVMMKLPVIA